MIARNLEKRIAKLEASWRRPNELLLVWRRPNGDVRAAASEAKFAPGDRVISLEWDGDGPLPPPRWFGKRLGRSRIFPTSRPSGYANCTITIYCT